jgi:hypothetical protein
MDLEFIQAFSPLFAHLQGSSEEKLLKSPLGSTAYYIFLIKYFPTNFRIIAKAAKDAMGSNINLNKLVRGRQDLLELGFISQVLPLYGQIKENFDRETFLPIAPILTWQDNVDNLRGIISPENLEHRLELIEELQDTFRINFGKYGVKVENESITLFHSSRWLLYFLLYNVNDSKNVRMLLGALGSFRAPFIKYYEKTLSSGLKAKIIYDPTTETSKERIDNLMKLKEKYDANIKIKTTPISHGTSRRIICDNMAIDGKKLVAFNSDLSYISTIYFQKEIIERMKNNFDTAFETSREVTMSNTIR